MASTYEKVSTEFGWPLDSAKLQAMQAANTAKLEELESIIKDAEENLGDTEVCVCVCAMSPGCIPCTTHMRCGYHTSPHRFVRHCSIKLCTCTMLVRQRRQ